MLSYFCHLFRFQETITSLLLSSLTHHHIMGEKCMKMVLWVLVVFKEDGDRWCGVVMETTVACGSQRALWFCRWSFIGCGCAGSSLKQNCWLPLCQIVVFLKELD